MKAVWGMKKGVVLQLHGALGLGSRAWTGPWDKVPFFSSSLGLVDGSQQTDN